MGSDFNEAEKNTQRCPKCGWLSVVKIVDDTVHVGLMFGVVATHWLCNNPKCTVERIYGDNCIYEQTKRRD
jgi:hypothetical protein